MATIRDRTFDPDGDLFLIVGLQDEGSPCHFQVSSKAMSLASRDWATMIKDNSELVNNLLQTLTLPHDDADALAVLLNIAHLRFDDVPFDLPLRTLTNVAILCDKYNVTHLARPYQNSWIKRHDANSDQPDPRRPALLLISWVFGCHVTFERLTRSEILEEMIYREPAVFEAYLKKRLADGRDFNWNCMPPAIFST